MTPERYRQVNALADAALQMRPDRRASFLDEVCGSDSELRRQIEALIEADSSANDFLEKPLLAELAVDPPTAPRRLSGSRIANYEVISTLGAGGIGEVWLARDSTLNREIALKLLSPRLAADPYHLRRFQQEALTASALNHPNIVTVYETGESEGVLYIAEERVTGETVRQRLATGPLPLEDILKIATQMAAALETAHSAGVVHRDIKPENVMVRPDGLVKVLDFGLARFIEAGAPAALSDSLSTPGLVMGTVRYMSPEQARGLAVDGRSDIFSFGAMLYEMAAGVPAFSGSTPTDTLAAILADQPAPLSRRVPGIPPAFERMVRRCLAKNPAERYASAAALGRDLLALANPVRSSTVLRNVRLAALAAAALACVAAAYLLTDRKPSETPFASMRITRVAAHHDPVDAAVSPDGKLLAYVAEEPAGQSVWLRNTADSGEKLIVTPEPGEHSGVTFSPDGAFLYYRRRVTDIGDLYRVAVNGGSPQRLASEISGAPSLSPDGRQVAFIRLRPSQWEASLVVTGAAGSDERTIATLRRPRYFDQHSVAWSPDGKSIACFTGGATSYATAVFHLVEIRLDDGSERPITPQSWAWPRSVAWSSRNDALIVTAASRGSNVYQLSVVNHADGRVTRITNDLSSYDRVTLTSDGRSLAAIQSDSSATLWAARTDDPVHPARIGGAPLRSQQIYVAWTPGGRILYTDPNGNARTLWAVDPDGANRRQLTTGPADITQIATTRDGRYVVYKDTGNIWRMDADGTSPRQLTHGPLDVHPDVTPDGRSVVYASFAGWSPAVGGEPTLWKAPIDGGDAVEIARQPASYPRVSPDGKVLGCLYFPGKDPRFSTVHVSLVRLDGTGGFSILEAFPSDETELAWSPDGKGLDYIVNRAGVGNLWRQPVAGGPPHQITNFDSDELFAFSWSHDGRLACARGATTRSLVRIELGQVAAAGAF